MLLFTAEVQEGIEWFSLTHQIQQGHGWARWQWTSLPVAGGLANQPARLMEVIALIAREENAVIRRMAHRARAGEDGNDKNPRG